MEAIVLTDEELKRLEARFGPVVRQMGPWNSDGAFGYASVPIAAVEKAAETLKNPNPLVASSCRKTGGNRLIEAELKGKLPLSGFMDDFTATILPCQALPNIID